MVKTSKSQTYSSFPTFGITKKNCNHRRELPSVQYSSDESSHESLRRKKARTTFTGRQIFELEKQFELKKYLNSNERSEMAKLLNVTETQVS